MYSEDELTKLVKFKNGPVKGIGLLLGEITSQSEKWPGDMVIYIYDSPLSPGRQERMLLGVGEFSDRPYKAYDTTGGCLRIALESGVDPNEQLRGVLDRLKEDGLITPSQHEKAYRDLGLGKARSATGALGTG